MWLSGEGSAGERAAHSGLGLGGRGGQGRRVLAEATFVVSRPGGDSVAAAAQGGGAGGVDAPLSTPACALRSLLPSWGACAPGKTGQRAAGLEALVPEDVRRSHLLFFIEMV